MIISVQILRAVAAYMVAFGHVPAELMPGWLTYLRGAIGVDLFFAISGYIMAMAAAESAQGSGEAHKFMARRLIRIYPTFIAANLIIASVMAWRFGADVNWEFVFKSMTLFPFTDPNGVLAYPYITAAWTLSFEMFFYLCMAALLHLKKYSPLNISILLGGLALVGAFVPTRNGLLATALASINLEFLMGVWIFWLHKRLPTETFKKVGLAALAIGLPTFLYLKEGLAGGTVGVYEALHIKLDSLMLPRWILWGIPSALVLLGMISLESFLKGNKLSRVISHLGDASYSLYLFHYFLLIVISRSMKFQGPSDLFVIVLVFTGFSYCFFRFVERPMIEYFKRQFLTSHPPSKKPYKNKSKRAS